MQQGDQLAAIDGRSAVHATIDEAASTITERGKDGGSVELTFLRYVGPLRPVPGSVVQEGFEVTGKRALKTPRMGRRKKFGKSSSSGAGKKTGKSSRGFFRGRRGGSKPPPSPGARSSAAAAGTGTSDPPRSPGRRSRSNTRHTTPPPSPAAATTQSATPGSAQSTPASKGAKGKSIRNILRRGKK